MPGFLENFILAAYFISLLILCIYGFHGYIMVYLYKKHENKKPSRPQEGWEEWPAVTVQLPIYNELYVVERLIDAACALDYPRNKLQIQVLDDSTDETVIKSRELVEKYQRQGINIQLLHRTDRTGYKAGALREALDHATGEFIAIFDADFIPPADFLKRTVAYFTNKNIGMVQARWGYLNQDYSLLTRAQAIGLDGHFVVEQAARNRSGYFINFNGTAGVWRKACIYDAGNWSDDTLTEDLDLSYRAQLRGWRFIFLQDVVCDSEIPAQISALKSQQFRWTKGAIETAKKILPSLWRARLPRSLKLQGTVHLTNNLVFPFILLVALLNLPLLIIKNGLRDHSLYFSVSSIFILAFFGSFLLYKISQQEVYEDWKKRIAYFPIFMAGSMGLSVSNTWAILLGLFNVKSEFQRTPKYRIEKRDDSWLGKKYQAKINFTLIAEMLMTCYTFVTLFLAIYYYEWSAVPFLAMFAFGFGFITTLSFAQSKLISLRLRARQLRALMSSTN
ncbi:MAG: glycosyltransferase [Calditrichaeota bacterium]|nr:MAG: glycosyltransferase [Calditrichota bacterium]